ncbi:hypothetical protein B0H16DRAFT_1767529 [Mycena metata]|uniref:F-box domain-containing protein n=1 Tax=Mycena metata TaxID=1033252 RepID=A0AAD7MVB2_9AGAR|nr:hypothetical protein B0H16DRAFT_1767529 [Mycena metata]
MSVMGPPHATGTPAWRQAQRDHLAEICDTNSQLDVDFHSDVPEFLDADRRKLLAIVSSFSYDVSTIPVEIISQIFVECLPADGRVRPSPPRAPLVLTQICRRWREIALGTGQLWRSFDFTLQSAAWCERANNYPLSLTLRCAHGRFKLPPGFLATIAAFAPHWERMELALQNLSSFSFNIDDFTARIGGPLLALSTLALTVDHLPYAIEQTPGMLKNLPQLRDFRLFNGLALSDVPIAFPALRHLGLWDIDFDLPAAPVLGPLPPVQSLFLDLAGSDVLAFVTLPHLRRLNYSIYSSDDIDTLLAFIGRSACALTHLTLRVHLLLEDFFLLQCLQVLPALEDLCIEYWHAGTRTLCNHLQYLDIVPHLHSLSFSELELGTPRYAYSPLVQMLQTRRRMRTAPGVVPRLSSFHLAFASSRAMLPYGRDAEKLGRLVEGGLRFRIHGRGL